MIIILLGMLALTGWGSAVADDSDIPECATVERNWQHPCYARTICLKDHKLECTYSVPANCDIIQKLECGNGNNYHFKMCLGLNVLCDKVAVLELAEKGALHDFVRSTDISKVGFAELPFVLACFGIMSPQG